MGKSKRAPLRDRLAEPRLDRPSRTRHNCGFLFRSIPLIPLRARFKSGQTPASFEPKYDLCGFFIRLVYKHMFVASLI